MLTAFGGGQDSFGGPSLHFGADELDRLDASHFEPAEEAGESPSLRLHRGHFQRLEDSINGTISALNDGPSPAVAAYGASAKAASDHWQRPGTFPDLLGANNRSNYDISLLLTPPSTGGKGGGGGDVFASRPPPARTAEEQQGREARPADGRFGGYAAQAPTGRDGTAAQPFIKVLQGERDTAMAEMQKICDERIDRVERSEGAQRTRLESQYKEQLRAVQQDLDAMLLQHQNVLRLRGKVEENLQQELDDAQRHLKRERHMRSSERQRHTRLVGDLKDRIYDLEQKLERLGGYGKAVRFAPSQYDDAPSAANSYRAYEQRLSQMQRENDAKISALVGQFEREKGAALQILKSKIKAQVNLLIPRIKERCQSVYVRKLNTVKDELAAQFRDQYEGIIRKMQDERLLERRLWHRQLRERLEEERREVAFALRAKYEMKIMEVKNECERRILDRLRHDGGGGGSREAFGRNFADDEWRQRPDEEEANRSLSDDCSFL